MALTAKGGKHRDRAGPAVDALDPQAEQLIRTLGSMSHGPDADGQYALTQVIEFATRSVPNCCGAAVELWRNRQPVVVAASHPDLADLFEAQQAAGAGPVRAVLDTGAPVYVPDIAAEERWERYRDHALERGVRCGHTLPFLIHGGIDGGALTLTLYGLRPGLLDPLAVRPAVLAGILAATALENAERYGELRRTTVQLQEALNTRPTIEQAKGVLMGMLHCDAETAFARLRQLSQDSNRRLADVATEIVESPSRPAPRGPQG